MLFGTLPKRRDGVFRRRPERGGLLTNILVDVKQEVWERCNRAVSVFLKTQITARERFARMRVTASIDNTYLFGSSKLQERPKAA
jgi:hypothetical protein